ncbi:nitroreductase/quinone reductase family protein [Agromyces sp. NPDC049794]|uniref:nitroreductase/quinone reductase family protein n=1 Tax=unclassified Agromyces TaxID=2639701 RepID=UPI003410DF4F
MTAARTARRLVDAAVERLSAVKRSLYRGGRPGTLMRWWNRIDTALYSAGVLVPAQTAVLEVRGRRTGQVAAVPVAVADLGDEEYLVSMLGPEANWVRNVEAAGGDAVLRRHGRDIRVHLEPVPVGERAPILRRYVAVAPGARPHLGLKPSAPLAAFARIAADHPVFRIRERGRPAGA